MSTTPNRVTAYVAGVAILATLIATGTVLREDQLPWEPIIGFAILAFLTAQFPLRLQTGALYDISFVICIAAIVAAGPAAAVIVNLFASASFSGFREREPIRHVFNASQLALSGAVPALTYRALGGPVGAEWGSSAGASLSAMIPGALLALAVATVVHFLINTTLVSGAIALSSGRPFRQVWRTYHSVLGNYMAFSILGLLLGTLQVWIGWPSVLFLLLPLLVARQAFQAAITMQDVYDDTVLTLIKAIETKDPYTRGHAERVSRLAEMTARAYGLPEARCREIRYAALMHDVGKLGVESSVLQKPGKLTPEEYEHMKIHPLRGVEIVGEIDLLREALSGIRHHHERMDGAGYPDGLAGRDIPLIARLIMVADAFDSMTSTRTYRRAKTIEGAIAELRRCAGTQFDRRALAALEHAIEHQGWQPQPEPDEGPTDQDQETTDDRALAT